MSLSRRALAGIVYPLVAEAPVREAAKARAA